MQVVCRDRNRLALQADIVGAALHGVENVCCLTGDDVTAGDEPEARRVFDLDGPQLIALAARPGATAATCPAARSTRRRTSSSARSRTRAPPPFEHRVRAGREEGAGRRPLPAAADLLRARPARGVHGARPSRSASPSACAILPTIAHRARRARAALHGRARCPASRCRPRRSRAPSAAADPQRRLRHRLEHAGHALSLPGVARPALHRLPPRRRHRPALSSASASQPVSERECRMDTVLGRGLGPSPSGPSSRSASSASASTRPGARRSRRSCRPATSRQLDVDVAEQVAAGADMLDVNVGDPARRRGRPDAAGRAARPGR